RGRLAARASTAMRAGCGAVAGRPQDRSGTASAVPASPGTPGGGLPRNTPPTVAHTVVARDQDNGHTLALRVGDHLAVILGSTYWQGQGSTAPAVLLLGAQPSVAPQQSGCVPGQGCGTVSATFAAVAAGHADVTAHRTSCGEAMSCTGNLGFYRLTVIVAA